MRWTPSNIMLPTFPKTFTKNKKRSTVMKIHEAFADKTVINTIKIASDGYIGVPTELTVLYDKTKGNIKNGYVDPTPIIIYTVGTKIERIGTYSDEKIISGMLDRGYAVCVLDYLENEKAVSPALDWSVQKIRQKIISGEFFGNADGFPKGRYVETFVVPSGYDVSLGNVYWQFDKHGTDGSLEKIVEIWNNDFRGVHANRFVKWVDKNGNRKETQLGHDMSTPVWYDEKGNEDENGQYIKVKHTKANDISDCAKLDGSMIDLNLYMHVIYPTAPAKKVPVMCLASSSEHLCMCSANAIRPHLNGFLFNGYAGMMYDYGYTPMARNDHYGYYDGNSREGCVTGDNVTYSMKFYNYQIDLAAMRYLRYLALSDEKFAFDIDAIGVFGNSKGGCQTYLGAEDPSLCPHARIFTGHHGETRYENGKTETVGEIRGGEEQPWLTYNGQPISSRANLVYSGCGATTEAIKEGHSPLFISCNRKCGSGYTSSNSMVNLCRTHDVPAMWLDIPVDHNLAYGEDLLYGVDSYKAFFDFVGYFLKGDALKVVGARTVKYNFPFEAVVLFSGSVDESEIAKITLENSNGEAVKYVATGKYGGVEWTFTPETADFDEVYTLTVPETLVGKNGKNVQSGYVYTFESEKGRLTELKSCENIDIVFEVTNDAVNTVSAYASDKKIGSTNVSGKGWYKINIKNYLDTIAEGENFEITLKAEKEAGITTVIDEKLAESLGAVRVGSKAKAEFALAPDGKPALRVDSFETHTGYMFEEFYNSRVLAVGCNTIVKKEALDESDMGRRFRISFKVFDSASRHISYHLNHCSSKPESIFDHRRSLYNAITKKGEWTEYSFEYTVYEPMYGDYGKQIKDFGISCEVFGNEEKEIYFADIKSEEITTGVEFGKSFFALPEWEEGLPEGKSTIVCPNNPWEKNLVLDKNKK